MHLKKPTGAVLRESLVDLNRYGFAAGVLLRFSVEKHQVPVYRTRVNATTKVQLQMRLIHSRFAGLFAFGRRTVLLPRCEESDSEGFTDFQVFANQIHGVGQPRQKTVGDNCLQESAYATRR